MVLVPFIFPLFRVLLRRADSNNLTVNFNIDVFLFHARKIGAQDVRLVVLENINRDDAESASQRRERAARARRARHHRHERVSLRSEMKVGEKLTRI